MKKLGLGFLGLIVLAAVYYFTSLSDQVNLKLQQELNKQLTKMQAKGFNVSERKIDGNKEHFVISLDDPKQVSAFFIDHGVHFSEEEAQEYKDTKLGVEVSYLRNSIALDLYPVALPTNLKSSMISNDEKKILAQIENMLERKALLLHLNINHLGTVFKGHIKDINETISATREAKLRLQGFNFSGNLKDEKLSHLEQSINVMRLYVRDKINMYLVDLKSAYTHTGAATYDYTTSYSLGQIKMQSNTDLNFLADGITLTSTSSVKGGLVSETVKSNIKAVEFITPEEAIGLEGLVIDMKIDNLDLAAFEKLQGLQSTDTQEFDMLLQKLISNDIYMQIPTLSAKKVTLYGKTVEGFTLQSALHIDKSLKLSKLEKNPLYALDKIDAKMKITSSKALLDVIKEDPKAMLTMMIFRPKKVVDNKRVYSFELKDGSLKVNGKSIR